jgi:hypothetical protein
VGLSFDQCAVGGILGLKTLHLFLQTGELGLLAVLLGLPQPLLGRRQGFRAALAAALSGLPAFARLRQLTAGTILPPAGLVGLLQLNQLLPALLGLPVALVQAFLGASDGSLLRFQSRLYLCQLPLQGGNIHEQATSEQLQNFKLFEVMSTSPFAKPAPRSSCSLEPILR